LPVLSGRDDRRENFTKIVVQVLGRSVWPRIS
jgi:hypothetical protein